MKKWVAIGLIAVGLTGCESTAEVLNSTASLLNTTSSVLSGPSGSGSSSSSTTTMGQGRVFAKVPDKITKEYEIRNFVIYRESNSVHSVIDNDQYSATGEVYNKSNKSIGVHISIPAYDTKGFNCGAVYFSSGYMDKGEKSRINDEYAYNTIKKNCKLNMSKLEISVRK